MLANATLTLQIFLLIFQKRARMPANATLTSKTIPFLVEKCLLFLRIRVYVGVRLQGRKKSPLSLVQF